MNQKIDTKKLEYMDNFVVWFEQNNLSDQKFFGVRGYEISYYTSSEVYWIRHFGNEELYDSFKKRKVNKFISLLDTYNIDYLVFPHFALTKKENIWSGTVYEGDVEYYKNHPDFEEVYSDGITVLKLREI